MKKSLVRGEDPNQQNWLGQTPLSLLFWHLPENLENANLLFLLLFSYGANLWVSVNVHTGYSVIEQLKNTLSPEEFEPIESWLKSPVYLKKSSPLRVDGIDLISTKKSVMTHIDFK